MSDENDNPETAIVLTHESRTGSVNKRLILSDLDDVREILADLGVTGVDLELEETEHGRETTVNDPRNPNHRFKIAEAEWKF